MMKQIFPNHVHVLYHYSSETHMQIVASLGNTMSSAARALLATFFQAGILLGFLAPEHGGDMFPQNVG
jgi:hypothetical protein